ncbi:hypothetical protein Anapl_03264 [Anas platyrhynchos]|uniref:Uncharacterized protein n=1 Tax=Anas platyrhynchos TaxID=8839 RepID=R0K411_ANAPL|nr:hypothetical protein Anapl_03264 [Anas platyrhynchos]
MHFCCFNNTVFISFIKAAVQHEVAGEHPQDEIQLFIVCLGNRKFNPSLASDYPSHFQSSQYLAEVMSIDMHNAELFPSSSEQRKEPIFQNIFLSTHSFANCQPGSMSCKLRAEFQPFIIH